MGSRVLFALALLVAIVQAGFWMEEIGHVGRSPYHPDPNYQVFRNVKDFGAKGDGINDDTEAINAAISFGGRCEPGACRGNTIAPATVYFPSGTYIISSSIYDLFYTQLIGNPIDLPVIKAASTFSEYTFGLIDSNPYQPGGLPAWNSTNAFYRQIRNLVIDTTALPANFRAVGIHWPSSQATALTNCLFRLSMEPGNQHIGLYIEEGSGGLLNDLYFYGGGKAAVLGNQQYTARNLWFFDAEVAILMTWDWGWTFKSVYFKDCRVGIQMDRDANSVGSITLIDSWFRNVETAIVTNRFNWGNKGANGTLAMQNVGFEGVAQAIVGPSGTVLAPSNMRNGVDEVFIMGHVVNDLGLTAQAGYYDSLPPRTESLMANGKYYEQSKPQYEQTPTSSFISARAFGAFGDGSADDGPKLNELFEYAALENLVVHLDAGIYLVYDTVRIPPNSRIVGEALASVIMASGPNFQNIEQPRPVIQVGTPGEEGRIDWSDTIVSTRAACAGAVLVQYNLYSPETPSGLWDIHARVGGFAGTDLQIGQCPAITGDDNINPACIAAFMSFHITRSAGGLFTENCWAWVADHDLEDQEYSRVTVFAGRGILVESERGRIWLSASGSEHHVLYQYQLANTRDVYIGHAQTESPYYQPHPPASVPFSAVGQIYDPDFVGDCQGHSSIESCESSWGMRIVKSQNIEVYGAGLYSFFDTYNNSCAARNSSRDCQTRMLSIDGESEGIKMMGLNTLGSKIMVQQGGFDLVWAVDNNSSFADTLALYQQ